MWTVQFSPLLCRHSIWTTVYMCFFFCFFFLLVTAHTVLCSSLMSLYNAQPNTLRLYNGCPLIYHYLEILHNQLFSVSSLVDLSHPRMMRVHKEIHRHIKNNMVASLPMLRCWFIVFLLCVFHDQKRPLYHCQAWYGTAVAPLLWFWSHRSLILGYQLTLYFSLSDTSIR